MTAQEIFDTIESARANIERMKLEVEKTPSRKKDIEAAEKYIDRLLFLATNETVREKSSSDVAQSRAQLHASREALKQQKNEAIISLEDLNTQQKEQKKLLEDATLAATDAKQRYDNVVAEIKEALTKLNETNVNIRERQSKLTEITATLEEKEALALEIERGNSELQGTLLIKALTSAELEALHKQVDSQRLYMIQQGEAFDLEIEARIHDCVLKETALNREETRLADMRQVMMSYKNQMEQTFNQKFPDLII